MDADQPSVTAGSVKLHNGQPGQVVISHSSNAGAVQIQVDAIKLERWCLRLLREETFKPAREAA